MRILGIDPGYAIVGFGVLEAQRGQARLVRCGAINTPAGVPMPQRLDPGGFGDPHPPVCPGRYGH